MCPVKQRQPLERRDQCLLPSRDLIAPRRIRKKQRTHCKVSVSFDDTALRNARQVRAKVCAGSAVAARMMELLI
jgi:hypothetical protein